MERDGGGGGGGGEEYLAVDPDCWSGPLPVSLELVCPSLRCHFTVLFSGLNMTG